MICTVLTIRPAIINISISLTISFLLPCGHRDNKATLAIFFLRFELGNVNLDKLFELKNHPRDIVLYQWNKVYLLTSILRYMD